MMNEDQFNEWVEMSHQMNLRLGWYRNIFNQVGVPIIVVPISADFRKNNNADSLEQYLDLEHQNFLRYDSYRIACAELRRPLLMFPPVAPSDLLPPLPQRIQWGNPEEEVVAFSMD